MPTVLITGASRGFGRSLFDVYCRRGWMVFPLVRDPSVAQQLQARGGSLCQPIVADVTEAKVESEVTHALGRHAVELDVLINNAGSIRKHRGLDNTSVEDLENLFRVHCVGAFRCVRGALPFLRRSERAVVVNVSSRWSSLARTAAGKGGDIYSYQIAKCAQNMLTACLDQELHKDGIRVLAVHPGRLMTEAAAPDADTEPEKAAWMLADWIETVDEDTARGLYDVVRKEYLDW